MSNNFVEQNRDSAGDENISFDFTNPKNAPLLYKPKEVLKMNLWLSRMSMIAIVDSVLVNLPAFRNMQQVMILFFVNNPGRENLAWLASIVIGIPIILFQCALFYFALKTLAYILIILMEMEFNSRNQNNPPRTAF
jgi:hypothetical protein